MAVKIEGSYIHLHLVCICYVVQKILDNRWNKVFTKKEISAHIYEYIRTQIDD